MSITVDVGKIKLVWKGTYSGATTYTPDDLVVFDDGTTVSAYINVLTSTGNVPSTFGTVNTTYWNLIAKGSSAVAAGNFDGQVQFKDNTGFGATSNLTFIKATSRLGIGTSTPDTELHVTSFSSGGISTTFSLTANLLSIGSSINSNFRALTGITSFSSEVSIRDSFFIKSNIQTATITAGTANATSNIDIKTSTTWIFTSNSSATWTHNIRGDASTSLNNTMSVGDTIGVSIISAQSNASYYSSALNIDGVGQTIKWMEATTPTSGSSSGYDLYIWTITKTGSATYIVIATKDFYS